MYKTKGQVTLNLLFLLYYQCKNPSIIVDSTIKALVYHTSLMYDFQKPIC